MKKIYTFCFFIILVVQFSLATGWSSKFEPQKVFIENKGQFKIHETSGFDPKVSYAFDGNSQRYYFTKSGVVFELSEVKKPAENAREEREKKEQMKKGMSAEEHAKMEREERRMDITKDELRAQWVGANPNVEIIAEGRSSSYFSYSFKDGKGVDVNENQISGFEKLTYKDLYPNIDVVYEMHPTSGIKYSVIVRPGGDVSKVRLQYSKNAHLLANGDIKTRSRFGDFVDHAPATFYADNKMPVSSSYVLKNNIISFSVGNYDHSKTMVIDPWTKTPAFNTQWQCVWECQKDAAGNVYIIGGVMPMQLLKYNSAGTLQWTYNTPYDTSNCWLGTFAVDNAGNSYVTAGSVAQIEKVNTAGGVVWNNSTVTGIFANTEFWTISFNCDQTQLVVGGTGGTLLSITPYIYNIDMTSGNVLNSAQVTGGALIPTEEVRAITACGNGNYYFLTHDSIGYIHQGLTSCLPPGSSLPFHVSNGYNFGYKCEDFRVNNTGIRAIKSFAGYIYTHRGNQVHKRNFNTGAIIATGTIPGGAFTNSGFGGSYVSNSGIDIDSCGNVYVGSTNGVVKFDANLNQLATFATSFNVYDVTVSPNGDLIAAGSTGNDNSGARSGYVQTFTANACKTIAIVCCDATICPHASACTTDAPFNLTATTPGGVWSGTGITNTSLGTFSPSVAGVGTFMIRYTLPCGSDSITISVNSCTATSLCRNANGTLTVSGGTAPYTWSAWDSVGQTCQGGIVFLGICTGTWVTTYGWTTFATGATATPPAGIDTLKVSDNAATVIYIYNPASVVPCNACNLALQSITGTNPGCGSNNGTVTVTATLGTAPYHYRWSNSDSTQTISNLGAGTYTVTITDANGCSITATKTLTATGALTLGTSSTAASCGNNNGTATVTPSGGSGYTYSWTNSGTTASIGSLSAGTYSVTVTSGTCTAVTAVTVASGTLTLGTSSTPASCGNSNGSATVTPSGGSAYTYSWTNSGTTATIGSLTSGTYSVTVTSGTCTAVTAVTVAASGSLTLGITATPATCGNNNGTATVTASGAAGGYTYSWSNSGSTASIGSLSAGTYTVTVSASGCTGVTSISVTSSAGVTASLGVKKNVSCFGGSTGSATITASGGTMPYAYTWSASGSIVDSATNLAAGNYSVTVKDASNCTSLVTFSITQPATTLSVTDVTQPAYCGNSTGKVYVTASGGTAGYTYTWSPGVSVTDSAVNLAAGSYLVTVTDANHCTSTVSATVQPAAGAAISLVSKQDVTCNGGTNGKIFVTANGGVGPYTYTWSPAVSTNDSAINLAQGSYNVTVHDANSCTSALTISIAQPAAMSVSTTTNPANCGVSDGSATATVIGGFGVLAYQWSFGASTTAIDTGLAAGSYTVTVTDANHCTGLGTAAVSNIGAPTAFISNQVNESCNGGNAGQIFLNVSGGTSPYTYTWSPNVSTVDSAVNLSAGTYNVTVHDASSCVAVLSTTITQPQALSASVQSVNADCGQSNGWAKITVNGGTGSYVYLWSIAQTTDSITGLNGGTYYITVSDSLGCQLTDSVKVGTNNGPLAPNITAGGPISFCQGDSVTLTSSAATGNTWSTGATTQSITVTLAGSYTVTQTVGSCTSPASTAVVVTVNPIPTAPNITASGPLSFCPGGSVTLTSSAASGNMWSDNETTQSITVSSAGTYTVSYTQGGCSSPASAPVSVSVISPPQVVIHANQLSLCPGSGSVTLDATTASATAYQWNTGATLPSIAINTPGFYQVTMTVNGCVGTDTITINSEPLLGTLSLPDSFLICMGDSVTLNATTPNATTYQWSGISANTPIVTVDAAGTYTVSVSNNCGTVSGSTIIALKDCECRIVMPNAFTPNGDGKNETFGPNFNCANATYLLMRIFNRWGEKVFETNDLNGQWDGRYMETMQPPGVYVYYVYFVGKENNVEKSFKLMGSLALIR